MRSVRMFAWGAMAMGALGGGGACARPAVPRPLSEPVAAVPEDPIDQMLFALGTSRAGLRPDAVSLLLRPGASDAPALTQRFLLRPLQAPYFAGHLAASHRHWSHSIVMLTMQGVGLTRAGVRRGSIGNPLARSDARLKAADDPLIAGLTAVWKGSAEEEELKALRNDWTERSADVPPKWRLEIGRLLMAAASAAEWQRRAFEPLEGRQEMQWARRPPEELLRAAMRTHPEGLRLDAVARLVDFDYLYAGALELAAAAEDFEDFVSSGPAIFEGRFEAETPLGWVVVRGGTGKDEHGLRPEGHHLLLIDLGGDDLYTDGVTQGGYRWPVQLVFDLGGDDRYLAGESPNPTWGAAVAGYSILIDFAGNDFYAGASATQGAAVLGAGTLIDRAGDDVYRSLGLAQGAGHWGLGLLQDSQGNDRYEAFVRAQGYGGALGVGRLLDESGDDVYRLNDTEIHFPSAQTREHNVSMGQGMGAGQRADLQDGKSTPGGVGLLFDYGGNDDYSAGVFAQGCGFWGGTGILVDWEGNDTYAAAYYAQGASAHQAAGLLLDRSGADVYETIFQVAQGAGHDFGLGWLADLEGNDRYRAQRLALGAANENGWGFFVDLNGDDEYEITAPRGAANSMGAAKEIHWGTMREDSSALGFFLDAGGADRYRGVEGAQDNSQWFYPRVHAELALRSERGIGRDGEFENVRLRTGPLTEFTGRDLETYAAQQKLRRRYRK